MVALTSRMQHEFNYDDEQWAKRKQRRLTIDPRNVEMKWIIDFCAQALRDITIGQGGKMDGFMMKSGFAIAVSSEVMAILSVATDLKDMRERMGRIVVAYDKKGNPVTTEALDIADRIGLKLGDYHLTESGFGADIGFEKFWNLKCRFSGLKPNAAVLVATIRALKCHGGAPIPVPGRPMPEEYMKENVGWVEEGCKNLVHHINTLKKAGINPVVCINAFYTDTDNEIKAVRRLAEEAGARVAVSKHWQYGGEGALELADAVVDACNEPNEFKLLYDLSVPLRNRIEMIAEQVYGADGVEYSPDALAKAKRMEADPETAKLGTCMVKTHLSLSDNPNLKGVPTGWKLLVSDILTYKGAGFVVPVAGAIKLMPGTSSDPAYRRVDVDTETGKVKGLF
jgi:formate--tetrahydrofolate ligase